MSNTVPYARNGTNTSYSRLVHHTDQPSPGFEYENLYPETGPQFPAASPPYYENDPSREKTPLLRRVHWRVPTTMAATLILGIAFAIIQHILFRFIGGRTVSNNKQQIWVARIATGLAFAAQTLLTTATGIAYIQLLIISVRTHPSSMSELDSMYGMISSPLGFFQAHIWFRRPFLLMIALVTWLLPLSAVVTPSSMSIASASTIRSELFRVPQLSFEDPTHYAISTKQGDFESANIIVSRLTQASAIQGEILPIPAPFPNSSYTLDFNGPGLSCSNVDSSAKQTFQTGILQSGSQPLYMSWAGPAFPDLDTFGIMDPTILDLSSNDSSKVYVAVNDTTSSALTVTECALMNVSYSVHFAFSSGNQNITLTKKVVNGVPAHTNVTVEPVTTAYQSIMYAMNQLLSGTISDSPGGSLTYTNGLSAQLTPLGEVNPLCKVITSSGPSSTSGQYYGACQDSSFPAALEELFQNMTLSLLSNQYFWDVSSTATLVNTTISDTQVVFVYKWRNLWVPYWTAIGCALVCTLASAYYVFKTGATYSYTFSSIVRLTRDKSIDAALNPTVNTGGNYPLPDHIANTKLIFVSDNEGGSGFQVPSHIDPY